MEDFFIDEWMEDVLDSEISEQNKKEYNLLECAGVPFIINQNLDIKLRQETNEQEEQEITDAGQFMYPAIPYWWWEILKNTMDINFRCGNIRHFPEEKEGLETIIFEWSYASKDFYALANLLSDICEYVDDSEDCYIIYQGYGMGGAISASSIKNKKIKKFTIIISFTRKCPCCAFEAWALNDTSSDEE
jgi:hypothetical protein